MNDADSDRADDMTPLKEYSWKESDILDAVNMGFGMLVHGAMMMRYFQMEK